MCTTKNNETPKAQYYHVVAKVINSNKVVSFYMVVLVSENSDIVYFKIYDNNLNLVCSDMLFGYDTSLIAMFSTYGAAHEYDKNDFESWVEIDEYGFNFMLQR